MILLFVIINDMIKRWWSWWQARCQPQGDQAPECIGSRFSLPWISSLTSTQQTDRFDTKPQVLIFGGMSANEQASYQSSLSFVFENYGHFLGFHIFSFCSHSVFWPTLLSVWIKFPNLVVFAPEVRLNGGTIVVLAERQMGLWAGWSSVCLLQSLLLQWIVCTG